MMKKKQYNRIVIIVVLVCVFLLGGAVIYSRWQEEKNVYVYEEHLEDIVATVDQQAITLRELGYYIVKMEKMVQEQALIYNSDDPMEYWNMHLSAGIYSGYMFEYAWDYALADCICDLIFEKMAREEGYGLSEEELQQVKKRAEETYAVLSGEQIYKTGLTIDLVMKIEERRQLVELYAGSRLQTDEISGYIDHIVACISEDDGATMNFGNLQCEIDCNEDMKNKIRMGKITVNSDSN